MSYEKVAYYVSIILDDLTEHVYEDLKLNHEEELFMNELKQELQIIEGLDEEDYKDGAAGGTARRTVETIPADRSGDRFVEGPVARRCQPGRN